MHDCFTITYLHTSIYYLLIWYIRAHYKSNENKKYIFYDFQYFLPIFNGQKCLIVKINYCKHNNCLYKTSLDNLIKITASLTLKHNYQHVFLL